MHLDDFWVLDEALMIVDLEWIVFDAELANIILFLGTFVGAQVKFWRLRW